jgi:hypothetical protein
LPEGDRDNVDSIDVAQTKSGAVASTAQFGCVEVCNCVPQTSAGLSLRQGDKIVLRLRALRQALVAETESNLGGPERCAIGERLPAAVQIVLGGL